MNDIGWAIRQLKEGSLVRRKGWNGKGMYIYLDAMSLHSDRPKGDCIVMYTAQKIHQYGWLASQADLLATDWEIAD